MTTAADTDRSTDPQSPENDPRDLSRLPALGEGTKQDNWQTVTNFMNLLAEKAVAFYTAPCDRADVNLQILEHGKSTPVREKDVIANKIRQDMLTLMSTLLRDPITKTISPEETGEPPEVVPFIDPANPFQPQQFQITDVVQAKFEQKLLDWHWSKAKLDADIWMATFNARTAGWYTASFEWNWQTMLPSLRTNISVRQILLDPAAGPLKAVETANWMFKRWRVNWWQARAMFPKLAPHMARLANEGPEMTDPVLPLGANEQSAMTGEKMIDLVFFWIRNYPVKAMTPEEALDYGEIEQRPYQPARPLQDSGGTNTDGGAQAEITGESDEGRSDTISGGNGADGSGNSGVPEPSAQAGQLGAPPQFFLPNGDKPITPTDPEWPWWLGTRQIARVHNAIAEDCLCPFWDPPFLHMAANPLPLSACGQGDPEAAQKIQEGHIRALTNAVEHSDLFAHPIKVYSQGSWDALPDKYKQEGASIAGMNVIVSNDLYAKLGGKISITDTPEPMSVALGDILEILGQERNDITPAPSVLSGKQEGDVTGWQSTQLLQQQATARFDLPAMFLQLFAERLVSLVRHAVLWFVPVGRLAKICSEYPPEVVEALVRRGQQSERNVIVRVNLSAGGEQNRNIAKAIQQFGMIDDNPQSTTFGHRVIGVQSLSETMGVDFEKETKRQQIAPPQAPQDKPSESLAFKDLPDSGKIQLAAQAGIQLTPQDLAEHEAKQDAKEAAKANNQQQNAPGGAPQ